MKRKNLKLIAHRVPDVLVNRLHRIASARKQSLQQTLADAIAGLSE